MISIDKHNLEEEIKADDQIMKEWARVLDEIPPCPAHGSRCVPHAVEWVISHRVDDAVKNA